jgi:hypothetical protein
VDEGDLATLAQHLEKGSFRHIQLPGLLRFDTLHEQAFQRGWK